MILVESIGKNITITGHANYAVYGEDIVCASCSSIVYTTVNAILNFDKEAIDFLDNDKKMIIIIKSEDNITLTLINNMVELLTELQNKYPKNIKVSKGD